MWQTIATLFNVCLLRRNPQDVPYSKLLLLIVTTIFLIFTARILSVALPLKLAIAISIISVTMTATLLYLMLSYFKCQNRLVQMMTSIIGVDLIIITSAALLILAITNLNQHSPMILVFLVMCWQLIVYSHIFFHGFMVRRLYASLIAIAYSIIHGSATSVIASIVTN